MTTTTRPRVPGKTEQERDAEYWARLDAERKRMREERERAKAEWADPAKVEAVVQAMRQYFPDFGKRRKRSGRGGSDGRDRVTAGT